MSEVSGMVHPRSSNDVVNADDEDIIMRRDMPVEGSGLRRLALDMLRHRRHVDKALFHRRCGVDEPDDESLVLTPRSWLRDMVLGRDTMSDADSPITANSHSKLIWKSMGSWRMQPDSGGRVYLECRGVVGCHNDAKAAGGPVERIRDVSSSMLRFEQDSKRQLSE